jgi:hypothetical protein
MHNVSFPTVASYSLPFLTTVKQDRLDQLIQIHGAMSLHSYNSIAYANGRIIDAIASDLPGRHVHIVAKTGENSFYFPKSTGDYIIFTDTYGMVTSSRVATFDEYFCTLKFSDMCAVSHNGGEQSLTLLSPSDFFDIADTQWFATSATTNERFVVRFYQDHHRLSVFRSQSKCNTFERIQTCPFEFSQVFQAVFFPFLQAARRSRSAHGRTMTSS